MTNTVTLTRPLDCTDSFRDVWTIPAGSLVTVHEFTDSPRCAVALDGRVYRSSAKSVAAAS